MSKPQPKNPDLQPPRPEISPGEGGPVHTPNCNDVLSGRGGRINSHGGNVNFRKMVESLKRDYLDPRTKKLEKARIAARLVATVRRLNPPGRFLKEDPHTGMWIEIGDERAWKKAGQALRESAPEIRAEQQAQLQAAVVAASMGNQGKSAMAPNSNGGRTDPPGPRHRPNPPEREGLARTRDAYDAQKLGFNPQNLQEDDDLELNQLRKEYYQMKRMQQEQQARMQQYQQNQGSFFDNQSQSQMAYQQQNNLENNLLAVTSGGFSMPLSHESQQIHQMQQIINMQNKQSNNFNFQQQQEQQLLSNAFERQFNSCDKTVSSMSTFDVQSMDMSSLGGFSSFNGNQSQHISFAGNLSQGMSINSIEGISADDKGGKASSSRKSALERKLEKFNEEHRRQRATHEQQQQQQQQKIRAQSSRNVQGQSVSSRGFAAIDEDEITDSSFKVSNLGFSEMEMTFNSDNLSIRSKSISQAGVKEEESSENIAKQPRVTASSIFDQSAVSDNMQSSASKANVSTRKGFNNSNISMEDFEESFRSMDMDDNRIGPVDPDGHVPVSGSNEKKHISSQSRRTGRQREPAGDRLPPFQPGMRYSGGTATDTTASRRGSGERNSLGSAAFGLSSNTLGLSDPLMGDFGVSMQSIRSFQSQGSDASSWLNHYQSMENICGNEKNPWEDECGSPNSSMSEISSHRMATAGV